MRKEEGGSEEERLVEEWSKGARGVRTSNSRSRGGEGDEGWMAVEG